MLGTRGLIALALVVLAAGCGSVEVDPSSTSSTGNGGAQPAGCPLDAPSAGAPCSGSSTCSYGEPVCLSDFACVQGTWQAVLTVCEPCPDAPPSSGETCSPEGLHCSWTSPTCNEAWTDATCTNGAWDVTQVGPGCMPVCPATLPPAGSACDGCCAATGCQFPQPDGCAITASCGAAATWVYEGTTCPPPSGCASLGTSAACIQNPSCRWLVTGCSGVPQKFVDGCYPAADCQSNADCVAGTTCQVAIIDPCWAGDCASCASDAWVCMP